MNKEVIMIAKAIKIAANAINTATITITAANANGMPMGAARTPNKITQMVFKLDLELVLCASSLSGIETE